MNWKDVSVQQYQQIERLISDKSSGYTDLDITVRSCSILYGMAEADIDQMNLEQLTELAKGINFISDKEVDFQPVNYINVNGRRYQCIYDIRKIRAARYIEVKTFTASDIVQNLHLIAASMVMPMRKRFGFWVVGEYRAEDHARYAEDMLQAPFTAVYGAVVFFCKVFTDSIMNLQDFFSKTMTPEQAADLSKVMKLFSNIMDGSTKSL